MPMSASFASSSERIQLPRNPMHAVVPGPGCSNPVADHSRPLRRSASMSQSTPRAGGGGGTWIRAPTVEEFLAHRAKGRAKEQAGGEREKGEG